jgi:nitrous oxidase accessory protein NosD
VSLVGGAKGNVVMHNRIESGSVWIGGASENLVEGNSLVNPPYASYIHAGVIMGHHPSPCSGLALVPAEENVVRYNGIEGAYIGVALMDGALRNKILDNKIYGAVAIGMHFSAGSADNDGRGNWFSGVARDVTDLGRGNLWP